ncbi:polygalacturonase-like [Mercurialis annua]|uniref:polygalacturonase-like n=1 Tax=Mercurialis annua TaxID=3986 RepID=UPI002160A23A|nr:polygalacturonase-like [Mercurialis annua]
MGKNIIYSILFLLFISFLFQESKADYNVIRFGAKADGKSDSTQAFSRAWLSACSSKKGGTVYVPKGNYLIKQIQFNGPCKNQIVFWIDGQIIAPNYLSFGNSGFWILFYKVTRLTIRGGTFDAKGSGFWACKNSGKSCPAGAKSITFMGSSDVSVNGLTSINSQMFHIAIHESQNMILENLKIIAPNSSPNTDGIHMQSSSGITIRDSNIATGDDCISLGPGSQNIWIQHISCGPGHGISIGSLAQYENEEGVQNVTVGDVTFTGTQNGVRIKSWGRPSKAFVKNIHFSDIIINNVDNPIIIDQYYCPTGHGCPNQGSGVKINGVTYKNIRGTSATEVAMNFKCSTSTPCEGLELQDIKLTYLNKATATSSCTNAHGSSTGFVIPKSCF